MKLTDMIRYGFALALLGTGSLLAQPGRISGRVHESNEAMPMHRVSLFENGNELKATQTDVDGHYQFDLVNPGAYEVHAKSLGGKEVVQAFTLVPGETKRVDLDVAIVIPGGSIVARLEELPFTVEPMQPKVVTHTTLVESGIRKPGEAAFLTGEFYQSDKGDPLMFRGSRPGSSVTFIDGMKQIGTDALPQAMIGQVSVLSGSPAEYGDFTGGAIIVQTYNPGMKGFVGKPKSRAEKKELRQLKKEGGAPVPGSRLRSEDTDYAAAF